MLNMNRRAALKTSVATAMAAGLPKISAAQVVYEQPGSYTAADLGGVLTPMGSIKAGNAAGTIPPWTGGYTTVPEGYQSGAPRPDPFAAEAPSFTITAANMAQYQNNLSAGLQAFFQKYADFTMQVYPSHRTAAAPQWVYDYIAKNATNAQLSPDGNAVSGAYGGIPFPIPKNGTEVIWNHELVWNGTTTYSVFEDHTVTADGALIFESRNNAWYQNFYYQQNGDATWTNGVYFCTIDVPTAPPYQAGGGVLVILNVNQKAHPETAFEYLNGERRVRRAPELQFDTPDQFSGGAVNWDEVTTFNGQLIEYDFHYLGNKEVFIPYNCNKILNAKASDQMSKNFLNPDLVRWELHRCRVVEMTLKPGYRNVDARRILYMDEDTSAALLGEVYDANGSLWKVQLLLPFIVPELPCLQTQQLNVGYDLHTGVYAFSNHYTDETGAQWQSIPVLPTSFFTPAELITKSTAGF